MSTNKFKIGDEVRIARLDVPTGKGSTKHNGKIGHIGIITHIDNGFHTLDPYCVGNAWLAECLELVSERAECLELVSERIEEPENTISDLFEEKVKQLRNGSN